MDEKELANINQIDLECNISDDDDLFISDMQAVDDREVQSKTGIIINFDDEDVPLTTLKADTSSFNKEINIESDFSDDDFDNHDYNSIDMETDYPDDLDDELDGLIAEDLLDEAKKIKTFGEVEDDYWEEISNKHKKTNKKGAYNTHFHIAGNPEREQDLFNHMMKSDLKSAISDLTATDVSSSSLDASSSEADASFGAEGCCESAQNSHTSYSSKLLNLFDTLGFEVFKNSDNSYVAIDTCDVLPECNAASLTDLISTLKPYLDDYIIYPLQLMTGKNFTDYLEWIKWYDSEKQKEFPKCASDISYCDLLANHLHECDIE